MLLRLVTAVGRHASSVMAAGVFLGLALPELASLVRPILAPAVATLLLVAMLRIDWPEVLALLRRPLLVAGTTAAIVVAAPLLLFPAAASAFAAIGLPAGLLLGVGLMLCGPPLGAATNMAYLMRLDANFALLITLAGTLAAPLVAPPLALWLLGLDLAIGVADFMLRLGGLVAGAIALSLAIRRVVGLERIRRNGAVLDAVVAVAMIAFAVAIMDGVGATLRAEPLLVCLTLAVACAANLGLQALAVAVALLLPRRLLTPLQGLTAGLLNGNRNLGLMLAAMPAEAQAKVLLFFAIAQIPMYFTPLVGAPIYRRLAARVRAADAAPGAS